MNRIHQLALAVLSISALLGTTGITASADAAQVHRASQAPMVINFWSSGPTQGITTIISNFNKAYKGKYQINFRSFPYTNETEIVNSALSAHRGPDMLEESLTPSAPYAYEGLEMPIEPILQMGKVNPKAGFPSAMWNGTQVKGVHYVVPMAGLPTLFFWNKTLFKQAGLNPNQPPRNQAEFIKDAKALTNAKKGQWGYVQEPAWPNPFLFPSLLAQFGGKEADPVTRKILFNSQAGIKALTFEYNTIYKWKVSPVNASANENYNLFLSGKNAMVMDGAYQYPPFLTKFGKNLGVALLPVIGNKEADFLGQNYLWVFRNPSMTTAKQKGIGLFLKYYYDHSMTLAAGGILPVWVPTLHSKAFLKYPALVQESKALYTGFLNPLIPNWGTTTGTYLYQDINLALLNKLSPQQALTQAAQKMQQEMATLLH